MAEVLLYNIERVKSAKIKLLCNRMGIASRTVPKEDFGVRLSALLGLTNDRTAQPDSDFDEEMLYFSEVAPPVLSLLLNQLRRQKTPVALKAVRTDTNIGLTSFELCAELERERSALSN